MATRAGVIKVGGSKEHLQWEFSQEQLKYKTELSFFFNSKEQGPAIEHCYEFLYFSWQLNILENLFLNIGCNLATCTFAWKTRFPRDCKNLKSSSWKQANHQICNCDQRCQIINLMICWKIQKGKFWKLWKILNNLQYFSQGFCFVITMKVAAPAVQGCSLEFDLVCSQHPLNFNPN